MMIDPDTLAFMRSQREARDRIAQRLGVAVLELLALARQSADAVERSVDEERAVLSEAMQRAGIPAGVDLQIDYQTGQVRRKDGRP